MKRVANDPLPKEAQAFLQTLLPVLLGVGGYIGFALAKDDPTITTKRFFGGLITAAFVAWVANVLAVELLHLSPTLASMAGAVLGSQGPAGAYLVVNKVKRLFGINN